jgi:hypothetical protein
MRKQFKPIVEKLLSGDEYNLSKMDDEIDRWHESDSLLPLHKWLGFTREEYAFYVEKPNSIKLILAARHQNVPLDKLVNSEPSQAKLAARGASEKELKEIRDWLKTTKRI